MPTGIVRSFNIKSGFGFIRPDDGSRDLFVHRVAVERAGLKGLEDNQKLSFQVRKAMNGSLSAVHLKLV